MKPKETLGDFLLKRDYFAIQMHQSPVGHFEIAADANNHKLLMLLDTGASKTVLHAPIAEKIGIMTEHTMNCGAGLGTNQAEVGIGTIETFKIEEMELNLFPINTIDLSIAISSITTRGGNTIDGIIGADILGSGNAVIDYGAATLFLKKVDIEVLKKEPF